MFSILIPTFNNLPYLKLCIKSIEKHTKENYEIILHINDGSDGTLDFIKKKNFLYTYSRSNIGLCSSINRIAKKAKFDLLLYSHDDMYFCPDWDRALKEEVLKIEHKKYYLSGTMIEFNSGHIKFNAGENIRSFNEVKLINNYASLKFYNHQGSHFAPHLVHKKTWNKVGGFSEEFNPGIASDPDFNMKLWLEGVRIFKGINKFRVYHFSSTTTRKGNRIKKNNGDITFLKKWGITTKFFKKYYLRSKTKYIGPLNDPRKNFFYYLELLVCKLRFMYVKLKNV
jgi:glycosyltransferase involved in cell wall biosynthesis